MILVLSLFKIVNMVTSFLTIVYSLHAFILMREMAKSRGHISVSHRKTTMYFIKRHIISYHIERKNVQATSHYSSCVSCSMVSDM